MRNLLARIGLVSVIAFTLAACPQNTGPTPPPPPPPPAGAFAITLAFSSNVSPSTQSVFQSAASKWAQIITGDLPDIAGINLDPNDICGVSGLNLISSIDDVLIVANVKALDGPGGLLGQAGWRLRRNAGEQLPAVGCMEFDSDDVTLLAKAGQLQETITHEMGHVLGFGTLWKDKNLLSGGGPENGCGATPSFTGANAKSEYAALGGSGDIPVEGSADGSGVGTCDSHWRETTFKTELMTGFLNDGVVNPISRMTIASMKDLGYVVNVAAGEVYSLNTLPIDLLSSKTKLNFKTIPPLGFIR